MDKNNIQIHITTWLFGQFMGYDEFGNKYYQDKRSNKDPKRYNKRWVLYAKAVEASSVPATWHGWLHHNCQAPLIRKTAPVTLDQQCNMTGTTQAYQPASIDGDGYLAKNTVKRYQAWQPDNK